LAKSQGCRQFQFQKKANQMLGAGLSNSQHILASDRKFKLVHSTYAVIHKGFDMLLKPSLFLVNEGSLSAFSRSKASGRKAQGFSSVCDQR
jgi:hypothetical protein